MSLELIYFENKHARSKLAVTFYRRGMVCFICFISTAQRITDDSSTCAVQYKFVKFAIDKETKRLGFKFLLQEEVSMTIGIKYFKSNTMISCKRLVDIIVDEFGKKVGKYLVQEPTEEEKKIVDYIIQF